MYGVLNLLPSEKGCGKMTRFACAVCFLAALCSNIGGISPPDFSSIPSSANISYYENAEYAFKSSIEALLIKSGEKFEKVSVSSYENESGGIYINEIAVYGAENKESVGRLLRENTGLNEEVKVYD